MQTVLTHVMAQSNCHNPTPVRFVSSVYYWINTSCGINKPPFGALEGHKVRKLYSNQRVYIKIQNSQNLGIKKTL